MVIYIYATCGKESRSEMLFGLRLSMVTIDAGCF